ncbi:30167_t:CDS:1, partial [Racocetra persica]
RTLFYNWYYQESSIIQFPLRLQDIYPPEHNFDKKELQAWQAIFIACGYINVIPISKKELSIEFLSKALNPIADKELLKNFYENNIIQLDKNISTPILVQQPNPQDEIF